ncbi:hypothetical protein OSTOST_06026 [Ostertagia ostertagi]
MCYYNGQKVTKNELIRLLKLEKAVKNYDFLNEELKSGLEYGLSAVLVPRAGDCPDFDIVRMEWGFIPGYLNTREEVEKMRKGYADASGKFQKPIVTLNGRGDELINPNKIYRKAGLERRCLVLSSGFYEWQHVHGKNKRTGEPLKTAVKYPYRIGVKDQEYFYMAGIWQPWTDRVTGEHVSTFAVVTTEANQLMAQVHNSKNRMPLILEEELAYRWMFDKLDEDQIREIANYQFPSSKMYAYTIERDFRNTSTPTAPFDYPGLAPLKLTA